MRDITCQFISLTERTERRISEPSWCFITESNEVNILVISGGKELSFFFNLGRMVYWFSPKSCHWFSLKKKKDIIFKGYFLFIVIMKYWLLLIKGIILYYGLVILCLYRNRGCWFMQSPCFYVSSGWKHHTVGWYCCLLLQPALVCSWRVFFT